MPKAFTRALSPRLSECELTHLERQPIDVEQARSQHSAYERILEQYGLEVIRLPELPSHPDGVFVEDTALLLNEHDRFSVGVPKELVEVAIVPVAQTQPFCFRNCFSH